MRSKGILSLFLILLMTFGLIAISYCGIGEKQWLSVFQIQQGLDLLGGVHIVYEAKKDTVTDAEMQSAVSLIQGRLDWNNWTEAEVAREGAKRLRVDIPGVSNAEQAITEIGQTAQLLFVDEKQQVLLTGDQIVNARKEVGVVDSSTIAKPYVSLEFSEEGKVLFAKATAENIGKPIYIVLDKDIISSPIVNTAITDGHAMISGHFSTEEAERTAALIRAGSLPFDLTVMQMENVGARLGANALLTGLYAGVIGILLILLFMLVVYKMLGLAASWALLIYISLEMIVLSLLQVTLTLPGIAGIILSIGMAVDANIIIFERIKEELFAGKTLRSSVAHGFSRAMPAILDSNITTLIAAGVLFWLGSGIVKGFAQTLCVGILVSMFTAIFVTRWILKSFVAVGMHNPKLYGLRTK